MNETERAGSLCNVQSAMPVRKRRIRQGYGCYEGDLMGQSESILIG